MGSGGVGRLAVSPSRMRVLGGFMENLGRRCRKGDASAAVVVVGLCLGGCEAISGSGGVSSSGAARILSVLWASFLHQG